ncbi:MAG: tetratricopeptide repeat protein [Candidatus Gastranaerophilales bacterium]|nr:tetratricopeptide repeat protein [Candidatus Gastranaerophilales bacterium]MCM1073639.1 tetratricopeptide repeat protein [Bacteroides sp.]
MFKRSLAVVFLSCTLAVSAKAVEVPMDAKLDYNQGIDFYKLGMYERAMESFRSAIRTFPDYIDAYYNLGTVLEYLKNYSEASTVFKQIYLRNPNDYEVIYKLANISAKLEDYTNAANYIALIPPASDYYKSAQELAESIKVSTTLPVQQSNPQSKIATHTGIYENVLSPTGITTDKNGNVYVATFSDNSIIKITPDNKRIVFLKSKQISGPISLASDDVGNIYVSNYNTNNVLKVTPQGVATVLVDKLDKPYGLHVNGNMLFITCQGSNSIYRQKINR